MFSPRVLGARLQAFILGLSVISVAAPGPAQQLVRVRTGNGSPGGLDAQVTFLLGPADGPFPQSFTPADFAAARSGPPARLHDRSWSLPSDPGAEEVTTEPADYTALFAVPFQIQGQPIQASLSIEWVVDNLIGGSPNQGIFINGQAISGNTMGLPGINGPTSLQRSDVAPLLVPGTNYLYVYCNDQGAAAALLFGATITYSATGAYVVYGSGCPGSNGTPAILPGLPPRIGQPFRFLLAQLPINQLAFVFCGYFRESWGIFPLPLPLGPIGMPGCQLYTSGDTIFVIPDTGPVGTLVWGLDLSNDPSQFGLQFYNQVFVIDPGVNPAGLITSNAGAAVIGR